MPSGSAASEALPQLVQVSCGLQADLQVLRLARDAGRRGADVADLGMRA